MLCFQVRQFYQIRAEGHPNNSDFINLWNASLWEFRNQTMKNVLERGIFLKGYSVILSRTLEWKGTLRVPPQPGCQRVCPPWAHRSYATVHDPFNYSRTILPFRRLIFKKVTRLKYAYVGQVCRSLTAHTIFYFQGFQMVLNSSCKIHWVTGYITQP